MNLQSTSPYIRINNLSKYFGDIRAVDDFSLDICRGGILGILGPNGAGKTTLIRMICGMLKPDSGRLQCGEEPAIPPHRLGICPQENICWPKLTCLEQLVFTGQCYRLSKKESGRRSLELLEKLGLAERSGSLAKKLSGGMKRRLSLALALVHDPEILVLDEPEAGLDPQSRVQVREYLRSLAGHKTVILTTHNMDEADRLSDTVVIMDHGKLLMSDSPEKLKKTIGEGDLLEAEVSSMDEGQRELLVRMAGDSYEHLAATGNIIQVKARNLLSRIPELNALAGKAGMEITEIRLRENTLEDVFIYLTGRTLRS